MSDERLEKLAELVITNPMTRRDYYTSPLWVLERMIPERKEDRTQGKEDQAKREEDRSELRRMVEDGIAGDSKLVCEREEHFKDYRRARLIAYNPKLRAEYFADPDKVLASAIPRKGVLERIWPPVPERVRKLRDELSDRVLEIINRDPRLVCAREGSSFLSEALRNPQRTFDAIVRLSIVAFAIGVLLLAGGIAAAFFSDDTTQKAVLGGASGGSGAVTILGTLLTITRDAIRKANRSDSQIRVILTGFGSEISHLRAIPIKTFDDAMKTNAEIRGAMTKAVDSLAALAREQPLPVQPAAAGAGQKTAGPK
jgi:hypothetical protein